MACAGVLDDVRERFLDDSVESRLDLRGEPFVGQRRLKIDGDSGLLGEGLGQALQGRDQAEVIEGARAQLDGEPANVLKRRDDQPSQFLDRCTRAGVLHSFLQTFQPQQDRRQRLPRLVVQLSRQPPALELLGLDDPAEGVARDSLREVDRERSPRRKRLGEAEIAVREADVAVQLVVGRQDPDRAPPDEQRHPEAGPRARQAHRLTVDVRVLDHGVGPLAATALEDAPALRGRAGDRRSRELGSIPGHCCESQFVRASREKDHDEAGALPQMRIADARDFSADFGNEADCYGDGLSVAGGVRASQSVRVRLDRGCAVHG